VIMEIYEPPGLVKARDEGPVGSRRVARTETIERGYGEGGSGGWTTDGGGRRLDVG
jgi:hypothetical protein